MEIIIQEGLDAISFIADDYKIERHEVTECFVVKVFRSKRLLAIVPYNVRKTIIIFEDNMTIEPKATNK
jgi:hypothetical protein